MITGKIEDQLRTWQNRRRHLLSKLLIFHGPQNREQDHCFAGRIIEETPALELPAQGLAGSPTRSRTSSGPGRIAGSIEDRQYPRFMICILGGNILKSLVFLVILIL